jgi:hypothetical protein
VGCSETLTRTRADGAICPALDKSYCVLFRKWLVYSIVWSKRARTRSTINKKRRVGRREEEEDEDEGEQRVTMTMMMRRRMRS